MKNGKSILPLTLLCLLLFTGYLFAQQNEKYCSRNDSITAVIDSLKNITPTIEVGSEYVNRVLLWGRDFGEKQFGAGASLKYRSGKGLYVYAMADHWSGTPTIVGFTNIGIGYEKKITDRLYFYGGYERWMLHHWDDYTRHALDNNIEAHLTYDCTIFNIGPGFYYIFGYGRIFQLDISISGEYFLFPVFKTGRVTIEPEAFITLANQSFILIYSDYPLDFIDNDKIKPANVELNVPIVLRSGNFSVGATAYYNVPVKISDEEIRPFFYFSLSLVYSFYFDKRQH